MNFRGTWSFLIFGLISSTGMAQGLTLQGFPSVVHMGENHQLAGPMHFTVTSDILQSVNLNEAGYFRLRFEKNVRLANTLVDPVGNGHPPIHLPLYTLTDDDHVIVAAPADTLSIVRAKAGEQELWLHIKTPTSQWLVVDGAFASPSTEHPVYFQVGGNYQLEAHEVARGIANIPTPVFPDLVTPAMVDVQLDLRHIANANPAGDVDDRVIQCGLANHAADNVLTAATPAGIFLGYCVNMQPIGELQVGVVAPADSASWLTHLPPQNGAFEVLLRARLLAEVEDPFAVLQPFNKSGLALAPVPLSFDEGAVVEFTPSSSWSHVTVDSDIPLAFEASYRGRQTQNLTFDVVADDRSGRRFAVAALPGDSLHLALVNVGQEALTITAQFFDADGQVIREANAPLGDEGLAPFAKTLWSLPMPNDSRVVYINTSETAQVQVFRLNTNQNGSLRMEAAAYRSW